MNYSEINSNARAWIEAHLEVGLAEVIADGDVRDLAALDALLQAWQSSDTLKEAVELVFPAAQAPTSKPN